MTRKEIAKSFLMLAGSGQVKEAYSKFIARDFRHHNQYFKGSAEALAKAMEDDYQANPNELVEVKHCYEDGDTIITHSLVVKKTMEIAVVHIFRFENDKIVELWDLGQPIEKDSPNENGLF
ncbi:nuclear transport factor 2 family protein [Fulvivirga lutea]|uniref:Ester cyclase n=1 Tax=Fulvivirga lutea TaxID=2810512 RepID=A0A974WGS6_9BACT|nr:ester cyclase [Fulvivirga lutea]QSE98041.1 ester cyclase [Fulvivirga lutea]